MQKFPREIAERETDDVGGKRRGVDLRRDPAKGQPPGGGKHGMSIRGHGMEEGGPPVSGVAKGMWHYGSLRKGTQLRRFVGEIMSSTVFKFLCSSGI